jgi:hypothetical protein
MTGRSSTTSSRRRRSSSRPPAAPPSCPGSRSTPVSNSSPGAQAKAYANGFIGVHVTKIAAGQTYAQVSAKSLADPKNATLAAQKAALFQGETLRGLLLGAWGWSMIGTLATLVGFILIALGTVLFLLPLANWQVNLRGRGRAPTSA